MKLNLFLLYEVIQFTTSKQTIKNLMERNNRIIGKKVGLDSGWKTFRNTSLCLNKI
jgi:hypothetical protein